MIDTLHTIKDVDMKISVVIAVYNEKNTIEEIVKRVKEVELKKEIIIVDDASTDGTRNMLKSFDGDSEIKVIYHDKNMGKGAALRSGFKEVAGDIVIIQDADLEYDPAEYRALIAPILEGKADVVYGSRFSGGPQRVHLFWHYVGNKLLTLLSNMCTNLNLSDMETCYKVFKADLLQDLKLESNRFGIEPELTASFARKRCKIYELPISYSGRDYSEGKKIGWLDGFEALYCIIKYNLLRKRS